MVFFHYGLLSIEAQQTLGLGLGEEGQNFKGFVLQAF